MGKIKYVLGFMFDRKLKRVALINKTKPSFQVGKLNGVGGKVNEGESCIDAMVREFEEETGTITDTNNWKEFAEIYSSVSDQHHQPFCISCYVTTGYLEELKSITDEKIKIESVFSIFPGRYDLVYQVDFLVGLALASLTSGHPEHSSIRYL